jgi:transketolase
MRTTRGAYPVLYGPDEAFPIGGAKVVRSSSDDQVTLVGAGVTLHKISAHAPPRARTEGLISTTTLGRTLPSIWTASRVEVGPNSAPR